MNNTHLINTLPQMKQDLCQEISMLKGRLQEEMTLLKEINNNFTKAWNSTLRSLRNTRLALVRFSVSLLLCGILRLECSLLRSFLCPRAIRIHEKLLVLFNLSMRLCITITTFIINIIWIGTSKDRPRALGSLGIVFLHPLLPRK